MQDTLEDHKKELDKYKEAVKHEMKNLDTIGKLEGELKFSSTLLENLRVN